jgi:hypothetical protein
MNGAGRLAGDTDRPFQIADVSNGHPNIRLVCDTPPFRLDWRPSISPTEGGPRVAANTIKSLQALSAEKQALLSREHKLIADLNAVLPGLGYRVVSVSDGQPSRATVKRTPSATTPKPLSCPHCDRTFGRPLHLGRHISAMHKGSRISPSQEPPTSGPTPPESAATKPRRRMSPVARRAVARRMKAYWKKRKAAERSESSAMPRGRDASSRTTRPRSKGRARRRRPVARS